MTVRSSPTRGNFFAVAKSCDANTAISGNFVLTVKNPIAFIELAKLSEFIVIVPVKEENLDGQFGVTDSGKTMYINFESKNQNSKSN